MILIEEANQVTEELLDAFKRLVPQLSTSNKPPSLAEVTEMVDSPAIVLFIARDTEKNEGQIVGTLSLALFRIPTAMRAWIEDVVVDNSERGKGIGEILVRKAIERAGQAGAKTVDLTSRPSREAANRLYGRVGFEKRETNIYRYKIK